jgi:uncharacterized membrane protein
MYGKPKLFESPLQILIVGVPTGLYAATLCSYIVYQGSGEPFWFRAGYVTNVMGMGAALMAAVPGFLDWLLGSSARPRGFHLALNVSALVTFTANAWIHDGNWAAPLPGVTLGIALAAVGIALTAAGGWLAWETAGQPAERVDPAVETVPVD